MKLKHIIVSFILVLCYNTNTSASDKIIISVADFGLKPNSRLNATPFIQKAIKECRKHTNAVLFFPKGRYDFWAQHAIEREYFESNTYDNNPKTLAIVLDSIDGLTIDGNDSEFIMHGRMQPLTLHRSNNITLRNFSIDWEIPLTAQGVVKKTTPEYMEIEIDSRQYPYVIEENKLTFVGAGWKSEMWGIMQFDPQTNYVSYNTGDNLGWMKYHAEEIQDGLVRISDPSGKTAKHYAPEGQIVVLRHNSRDHAGIFIFHSQNTTLSNINIHHTGGLGVLSQYSKNINFDDVHVIPNKAKGRVFSGHDDGFHFMGCSGLLKIENCSWAGLMDDPINIHGTSVRVVEIISPTRVKCKFMHSMSEGMEWGRINEQVGFIENNSMRTVGKGVITKCDILDKCEFIIDFASSIPSEVRVGYALENLTCVPDAEIRNCHFGSSRARGLLVSTPGKVTIENNIFESSGSAILIPGDANQWYESGAVKDVTIRNNEFRYPCNSSIYQFCEAVISIFPEIPHIGSRYQFHRNIKIEGNTFHLFDYPILYARSVDGLTFSDNILIRNNEYEPFHYRKDGITIEGCKNVLISNNKIEGDVLGKTIILDKTKKSDIKLKNNNFFKVK